MAAAPRRMGPLSLGDVLDETIRIYRAGFKSFLAAMALPLLPAAILLVLAGVILVTTLAVGGGPSAGAIAVTVLLAIVFGLLIGVAYIVAGGAVTRVAADYYQGTPTRVSRGYAAAFNRIWVLIGTTLLIFLGVLGLMIVSAVLSPLSFTIGWLVAIVGSLVWLLNPPARRNWLKWVIVICAPFGPVLYFGGLWMLYGQVVILEGLGPTEALRRSKQLVSGYWWRVIGTVFLLGILVSILQAIPQIIFTVIGTAVGAAAGGGSTAGVVSQVFGSVGQSIGAIIFGAIQFIALTILYFDLRVRKEALDLDVLAERQLGPVTAGAALAPGLTLEKRAPSSAADEPPSPWAEPRPDVLPPS
jgi:MFS family permease